MTKVFLTRVSADGATDGRRRLELMLGRTLGTCCGRARVRHSDAMRTSLSVSVILKPGCSRKN